MKYLLYLLNYTKRMTSCCFLHGDFAVGTIHWHAVTTKDTGIEFVIINILIRRLEFFFVFSIINTTRKN